LSMVDCGGYGEKVGVCAGSKYNTPAELSATIAR